MQKRKIVFKIIMNQVLLFLFFYIYIYNKKLVITLSYLSLFLLGFCSKMLYSKPELDYSRFKIIKKYYANRPDTRYI